MNDTFDIMKPIDANLDVGTTMFDTELKDTETLTDVTSTVETGMFADTSDIEPVNTSRSYEDVMLSMPDIPNKDVIIAEQRVMADKVAVLKHKQGIDVADAPQKKQKGVTNGVAIQSKRGAYNQEYGFLTEAELVICNYAHSRHIRQADLRETGENNAEGTMQNPFTLDNELSNTVTGAANIASAVVTVFSALFMIIVAIICVSASI